MRVLLDHSACEVFLSTGEVLSTRIYRGTPPLGADAGVDLVSYGGVAVASRVEAFEMGTSAIVVPSSVEEEEEEQVGEEQEAEEIAAGGGEAAAATMIKRRRGGLLAAVAAKQAQAQAAAAAAAAAAASAKPAAPSSSSAADGTLASTLPAAYEPMAPAVGSPVAT